MSMTPNRMPRRPSQPAPDHSDGGSASAHSGLKLVIALTLAAALLAIFLQGCGGGDAEPDRPAEIPKPPCAASREACL